MRTPVRTRLEDEGLAGLALGADDYVTKSVTVRTSAGAALERDVELPPTNTEFHLLRHFVARRRRVWSREHQLEQGCGLSYKGDGRSVDTHVARLRAKLETDPAHPRPVHTVCGRGHGFSLRSQP